MGFRCGAVSNANRIHAVFNEPCVSGSNNGLCVEFLSCFICSTGEKSKTTKEVFMNILSAELMFPDHVSELARDLLSKILSRSYGERIKGRDIRNHPFFEDVDLENIVKKIDIPPLQPRLLNHDALAAKKDFLRQAATAAHKIGRAHV